MNKIKGLSNKLKKLEDERFAIYGKKPLTEAEIKERILRENKEAAERLRKKKEDPDFASGGLARVGFSKGKLAKWLLSLGKKKKPKITANSPKCNSASEQPSMSGRATGTRGIF